jgi:hypothetical protein
MTLRRWNKRFLVTVALDGLPPVVHVREVPDDVTPGPFAKLVGDLDYVRPAAVDCLVAQLVDQLVACRYLLVDALDAEEYERAESGLVLCELFASYAVPEDGFCLDLDKDAAALFVAHGVEPRLWGWTLTAQGGDADTA